ncbi:MAG: hypothetical protein K6G42_07385 [Lachnospiraceae bacterium]|nr:hypothetical protein [Lachnospiraceae bacterium]
MKEGKKNGKLIRTLVFAAIAAGSFLIFKLAEAPLIIAMGVRAAGIISVIVPAAAGIGAAASAADLISTLSKERKKNLEARAHEEIEVAEDVTEEYAKDASNPEITRKRLEQIRATAPGTSRIMNRCLEQMDRMDELQRRQLELMDANSATYLKDTVTTLDQVERELCLNYRSVVNQCIIAGSDAGEDKLDMSKVENSLGRNDKLLSQSKELLTVSADWVDKYNEKNDADRSLLDNWIKVIQDTISKEDII